MMSVQPLISGVEDLAKWTHTGKTSACLRMIVNLCDLCVPVVNVSTYILRVFTVYIKSMREQKTGDRRGGTGGYGFTLPDTPRPSRPTIRPFAVTRVLIITSDNIILTARKHTPRG